MTKISKSVLRTLGVLSACVLVSGAGLFLYVHHLKSALHEELISYLNEVAAQGVHILNTQIKGDVSSLQSAAAAISTYKNLENKPWADLLREETRQNEFKRMAFILPNGVAYLSDGFLINLEHRDYFQKGMKGIPSVSDPLTDAVDQGKAIILSVIPDLFDGVAHNFRNVHICVGGNFPHNQNHASRCSRFTGHSSIRILRQDCIKNAVRNLVAYFIWMSFTN